ncbi:Hypothetical protein A7982_01044 [Minicystis rosea]|nr:Hypothetical protein A7982_01044 [Minicystis rosea]
MPRNTTPELLAFEGPLKKGALVLLPKAATEQPAVLTFQYNPESITRNRTGEWAPRKNQKDQKMTPAEKDRQASLRGAGLYAKAETIAMKLVFDATELSLRDPVEGPSYGVLPELGVLEGIALAEAPKGDAPKKDAKKDAQLTPLAPKEVLLVLGARCFPVIVTSMNIVEKRFSRDLVPLRAEVDLQMQILEASDVAGHKDVIAAYDRLVKARQANAARATADTRDAENMIAMALKG